MTDQRSPRTISEVDVDWYLILHAVRHAVSQVPRDVDELVRLDEFEVELPFPLSTDEHCLAQSWVGPSSPVTYWPEDEDIRDGRHRLWLTRTHHATCDVPLLDEHLIYLDAVRAGHIPPHVTAESIAEELAWWAQQPDALRQTSAKHQDVLRHLHLELAPDAPTLDSRPSGAHTSGRENPSIPAADRTASWRGRWKSALRRAAPGASER